MEGKINYSDTATINQSKQIETTNHLEISDLLEEILLKLPVKSLLKFRCVSKSWLSLISSRQFIKAHFEISSRHADFSNHAIMFTYAKNLLKQCPISSMMSKSTIVASGVDFPHKSPHCEVRVVGSCNGIICVAVNNKNIFLWNPSTRKSKALPPDVEMRDNPCIMLGFGFSESEDDYKVVGMFPKHRNYVSRLVKVYSLRTDSWKRIEDFNYGIPSDFTATFASGKLHFGTGCYSSTGWKIVSFDLKSGVYGIVEQPNYGKLCYSGLGTLRGCLSVIRDYRKRGVVNVWVLNEYGVKESWTRMFSIRYFNNPDMHSFSNPLLIMPNGKILFGLRKSLVVYNPRDSSFKHHLISNLDNNCFDADIYVESLVPVVGDW